MRSERRGDGDDDDDEGVCEVSSLAQIYQAELNRGRGGLKGHSSEQLRH